MREIQTRYPPRTLQWLGQPWAQVGCCLNLAEGPSLSRSQLLLPEQVRRKGTFSRPSQEGNERPFREQRSQLGGRDSK